MQKANLAMQLMCMRGSPIWSYLQVTKKLSNSEGAKSKHNTDHAIYKLVLRATQRILRSGYLEWLQLQAVRFPRSAAPDMPEFLSVSATEEQADEQSAMEEEDDLATD